MVISLLRRKPQSTKRAARPSLSLDIDGEQVPVHVVENARARRLTLRIVPGSNSLKVTIPPHVSNREVAEFVERNRNWAAARLARMPKSVAIEEGAVVPFKGIDHKIIYLDRLRGLVEAREVMGEPTLLVPGDPNLISKKLIAFMKKEAREELNAAVMRHAKVLNVRPKTIRITDTTSRWGSCSSTRTLSFSWRIIMAPPEVLDYLAAHEVAHLREMNHSDRFWNLVRSICPEMDRHKAWLRTHGATLHAVTV